MDDDFSFLIGKIYSLFTIFALFDKHEVPNMHNVMKNILRFIFILFLIFLSLPIFSRSYAFRGLSVTEGLSDLVVNAIYKDSLGYVWLGTGNSLECFDGIHFKHYLIPGSDEKLKRVNAIAEMPGNDCGWGMVVDYGVLASRKIVWSPLPVKR